MTNKGGCALGFADLYLRMIGIRLGISWGITQRDEHVRLAPLQSQNCPSFQCLPLKKKYAPLPVNVFMS